MLTQQFSAVLGYSPLIPAVLDFSGGSGLMPRRFNVQRVGRGGAACAAAPESKTCGRSAGAPA